MSMNRTEKTESCGTAGDKGYFTCHPLECEEEKWDPIKTSRANERAGRKPARPSAYCEMDRDYGFTTGAEVPAPQPVLPAGHTSGPVRSLDGAIVAPASSSGVQPLPSHAASKSTDRRFAPTAPNMETITQF